MKSFILCALAVVSLGTNSFAQTLLVSGYDDVLRQANNQTLLKGAIKLFAKDKTFAGMPELYDALTANSPALVGATAESKFVLISGTSNWFKKRVQKNLRDNVFPEADVHLRNWIKQRSVEDFKVSTIQSVMDRNPTQKFIVIFDNSEASVEMAASIPKTFPGKVQQLYLHEIAPREKVENAIQYVTAFDIALQEFKAGRLASAALDPIANAVVNANAPELIPVYAYCPKDYDMSCDQYANDAHAQSLCTSVQSKVRLVCSSKVPFGPAQ